MDYGYQLLRHIVQQVFGNVGHAARITLPLLAIPVVILLATNLELILQQMTMPADPMAPPPPLPPVNGLGLAAGILGGILAWCWAAVAWHRFVLLEEYPAGALPVFRGTQIFNYLGNSFLIVLVMILAGMVMGIGLGLLVALFQSPAVALVLGIGIVFGLSWMATRIGLILPAAAIGERLGMGESWRVTAPVSGQIVLPIVVIALVSGLLNQAVPLIFGVGLISLVISMLISWLQLLVNLALMTTLYGNLVEGRALN